MRQITNPSSGLVKHNGSLLSENTCCTLEVQVFIVGSNASLLVTVTVLFEWHKCFAETSPWPCRRMRQGGRLKWQSSSLLSSAFLSFSRRHNKSKKREQATVHLIRWLTSTSVLTATLRLCPVMHAFGPSVMVALQRCVLCCIQQILFTSVLPRAVDGLQIAQLVGSCTQLELCSNCCICHTLNVVAGYVGARRRSRKGRRTKPRFLASVAPAPSFLSSLADTQCCWSPAALVHERCERHAP